jgi:hypothetical protein
VQTDVRQVFYFHASATSLGGFMEGPYRNIPTPCSAALGSTGGSVTAEAEARSFEVFFSHGKVYTHVSGRHVKRNGPWVQRVVSIVEGFKLLGRIEASHLVTHMHVEHPAAGGGPRRISFAGSTIENLRVDGRPVALTWNPALLPRQDRKVDAYNHEQAIETELEWSSLGAAAHRQSSALMQNGNAPAWVLSRYGWVSSSKDHREVSSEGYAICSLVDKIDGLSPNQSCGHCIELPEVGRIFLGEVTIFPQAVGLTMIRAELGCNLTGQLDGASGVINGVTCPPS